MIDAPIARHPESIIQRRVDAAGKTAQTRFKRVEYKEGFSMCEVTLLTGRTHQIRVHFQHIGHSIVGDALYGGKHESYHHQLLRCTQVAFIHPIKNQNIVMAGNLQYYQMYVSWNLKNIFYFVIKMT